MSFYMGKDCVCGHYRTNHKTVKGKKCGRNTAKFNVHCYDGYCELELQKQDSVM